LQTLGIVDCAKRAVEDVVAAVGDERLSLTCHPLRRTRAQPLQLPRGRLPRERNDFHCHGTLDAEAVSELGLVDDDDQLLTGTGNDLFAQKRSAATFQQTEPADIDLVRPVDRDVNVIVLRQCGKGNTQTTSLAIRLL
jgi:hypothetical protein